MQWRTSDDGHTAPMPGRQILGELRQQLSRRAKIRPVGPIEETDRQRGRYRDIAHRAKLYGTDRYGPRTPAVASHATTSATGESLNSHEATPRKNAAGISWRVQKCRRKSLTVSPRDS